MTALSTEDLDLLYNHVGSFSEGLAPVQLHQKDGVQGFHIYPDGRPAYTARYFRVGPFSNGLASANHGGSAFHIFPDGTPAYDARYNDVGTFSEGLATARIGVECFHIKPDGTPAYKDRYDFVGTFSEGLAMARAGWGWFHIKPDGTPAYANRFDSVKSFSKGRARVTIFSKKRCWCKNCAPATKVRNRKCTRKLHFFIKRNGDRVN